MQPPSAASKVVQTLKCGFPNLPRIRKHWRGGVTTKAIVRVPQGCTFDAKALYSPGSFVAAIIPDDDYPSNYEATLRGRIVHCLTAEDAIAVAFADRLLSGVEKANGLQTLFVAEVLRSYGCYAAADDVLNLASDR